MEKRTFGKTGYPASIITLGGCGLGWLHDQVERVEEAQKSADTAIKQAFDAGINIIDVAPTYGDAEVRLRPWVKKYRKKIFLAGKTMERTTKRENTIEKLGVPSVVVELGVAMQAAS